MMIFKKKRLSLNTNQAIHKAGAYPDPLVLDQGRINSLMIRTLLLYGEAGFSFYSVQI